MGTKTILASVKGVQSITASPRYQYDYGQVLKIVGDSIPNPFTAHFCNEGDRTTKTVMGSNGEVLIPDEYFLKGKDIICFIMVHDELGDGRSMWKIVIPIKKRPKDSDIRPEPIEQDIITVAIAALNSAVDITTSNKNIVLDNAQAAADSAYNAAQSEQTVLSTLDRIEQLEQQAGSAGWVAFEIVDGELFFERTPSVPVDFSLVNGDLIMEAIDE